MSDESSSDDNWQLVESDRFASPIEFFEPFDSRSLMSVLEADLEPLQDFIFSNERNCSSNGIHNLPSNLSTESHGSSPLVKYEEFIAQLPDYDSSTPCKKYDSTPTQSSENGFPSSKQKHVLTDAQSFKNDCSNPDKKHELTSVQIPESIPSYNPNKKYSTTETYSLEKDCSSSLNGNHNLVDTHLHESVCSNLSEKNYENYTQLLQMNSSSFSDRKCNLVIAQSHKISESSPNPKQNLFDTTSSKDECTSSSETYYQGCSYSSEIDISLEETLKYESNCDPLPHRKHKLSDNGFSDNDSSPNLHIKRRLISGRSFENDLAFSSTESIFKQSSVNNLLLSHLKFLNVKLYHDVLLKLAGVCEKDLRLIIKTAYQFTRHSNRVKLTLKDLERAFKIHDVDIMIDSDSAKGRDEFQPITCTGMWLKRLGDMNLNE